MPSRSCAPVSSERHVVEISDDGESGQRLFSRQRFWRIDAVRFRTEREGTHVNTLRPPPWELQQHHIAGALFQGDPDREQHIHESDLPLEQPSEPAPPPPMADGVILPPRPPPAPAPRSNVRGC
eukprot:866788-Amphidinium_carterae.3